MIRLLTILLILILPLQLLASHIVGGEMYYDCLGNDQYKITVKVYRDCNSDGAEFDNQIILGIFNRLNNERVDTKGITQPQIDFVPVTFSNPCVSAPTDICVQEAIYSKVITLPPLPEGYILAYERCCRGADILNLLNPGGLGLTITTTIPGTNSGVVCNSSPRFDNYPPLLLCNNETLYFDHSATDPDGDQLVYEFNTPFNGGSPGDPMPVPTNFPPYDNINWELGFGPNQPFGASGPTSIDPNTGELIADPSLLGKFVVGIVAKEYRNGVLIGSTSRDFLFTVFDCIVNVTAEIVPQEDMYSYNSLCDGLTINFENNSVGGNTFYWDFGVPSDPDATSEFYYPTYTFPSEGSYTVTMIVNPNTSCADTSVEIFNVYSNLNVFFDPQDPQCVTNNSFNFMGEGDYQSGSTFNWVFGDNANQNNVTTEDVNGVVFDSPGSYPVTYTVQWNDCIDEYTDTIEVHSPPIINFDLEPGLFCAPKKVQFIDSSTADATMVHLWDFGDGNTSNEQNPTHVYETPGVYDVTLSISTDVGCIAALSMTKPDLVEVFSSPVADFTVTPAHTNVFETEITFTDQSIDSDEHFYQLTPTVDTTERNLTFHYLEGGNHYPYQVVTNEHGCKDTATRVIFVEPYTTLYVPNAFTPDGNKFNDIFKPVVMDVTEYEFTIYNRWGEVIFKTNNPKEGWNGRVRGQVSPDGVYLWRIEYVNHRSIGEIHHGNFSLMR